MGLKHILSENSLKTNQLRISFNSTFIAQKDKIVRYLYLIVGLTSGYYTKLGLKDELFVYNLIFILFNVFIGLFQFRRLPVSVDHHKKRVSLARPVRLFRRDLTCRHRHGNSPMPKNCEKSSWSWSILKNLTSA